MHNTCKLYLDELSMYIGTSDLMKNSEQMEHCSIMDPQAHGFIIAFIERETEN